MRVHSRYQIRGGEDESVDMDCRLLEQQGEEVLRWIHHNSEYQSYSFARKLCSLFYNRTKVIEFRRAVRDFKPDVVHIHNTFPLLSPAIVQEAKRLGLPVVATLHNFRLICPGAYLNRGGKECRECVGRIPWRSVMHGCYRDILSSIPVAALTTYTSLQKVWLKNVDKFICISEASRQVFIEAGFPASQLCTKGQVIMHSLTPRESQGEYVIYVGRLSAEKGITTLIEAWKHEPNLPSIVLVGDGPLEAEVQQWASNDRRVKFLGRKSIEETLNLIRCSSMLVFPSIWQETFGRVALEAFSLGVPVVSSNLGAMKEMNQNRFSGLTFEPGNWVDLSEKILQLHRDVNFNEKCASNALSVYNERYSPYSNYTQTIAIYREAISSCRRR
jgi:glycosyltransferase involved in cell wall biosynthesis